MDALIKNLKQNLDGNGKKKRVRRLQRKRRKMRARAR